MSNFATIKSYLPMAIKNKFAITGIIFIIWICFFDTNKITTQVKMNRNLEEMKAKQAFYKEQIAKVDAELEMFKDPEQLERFAREEYLLKKANEDIIVIE